MGRAELPETLGLMLGRPLAFTGTETQILTCWGPGPRFYPAQNRSPNVLGPAPHFYRDQNRSPDVLDPAPRFYQDPNRSSDVLGAGPSLFTQTQTEVLTFWGPTGPESSPSRRVAGAKLPDPEGGAARSARCKWGRSVPRIPGKGPLLRNTVATWGRGQR